MPYAHRECPIQSENQKFTTVEEKASLPPSFLTTKRTKRKARAGIPAVLQHYLSAQQGTEPEVKHSSSHVCSQNKKKSPVSCIKHLALNKIIYIVTCLYIVVCTHPTLTLNAGHLLPVCHRHALRRNTFNGTYAPRSSRPSNKFSLYLHCTTHGPINIHADRDSLHPVKYTCLYIPSLPYKSSTNLLSAGTQAYSDTDTQVYAINSGTVMVLELLFEASTHSL